MFTGYKAMASGGFNNAVHSGVEIWNTWLDTPTGINTLYKFQMYKLVLVPKIILSYFLSSSSWSKCLLTRPYARPIRTGSLSSRYMTVSGHTCSIHASSPRSVKLKNRVQMKVEVGVQPWYHILSLQVITSWH